MEYRVGIDIGSTTLKVVVLDTGGSIVYKSYERHLSQVRELTVKKLQELKGLLDGQTMKAAITGSAGLGVAEASGVDFVQEVFATAGAVRRRYPATDVVIELGGEDAKIIFLQGAMEERMNSTCAGGTGAFIDQMASLLNITVPELDKLSLQHTSIYPIASRCGVFAKTDIQPLINQGAKKENIAASIYQAVVDQTIAGLAQGRPITGNVLFLGGPLAFLKGLRERFVETLHLDEESAVFPDIGQYFVALGAAYYAGGLEKCYSYEALCAALQKKGAVQAASGLPPLFATAQDYEGFCRRHARANVPDADIATYTGGAYLGVDAGSTTTKICLVDEQKRMLYSHYCSNLGSPLDIVEAQLKRIYELSGGRIQIKGAAATGYGEDLIKNAFNFDFGIVETIAHYRAARHFNPEADFIIDIGGQDIKCFEIRDGAVSSVMLNEACSSGCGSFIETFAKSLGYGAEEFAKLALDARHPVDLGTRCTVFMNSSVKQAQKNGATVGDISAGLAVSVVKNAIYKVIRAKNADELGKHIVVQGGTFLNDAVLRSFEQLLGREVTRPAIAGLMGAFGAAVFAMEHSGGTSSIISAADLAAFTHTSKTATCNLCTNHCSLTVNMFANGNKFISGNRCERPLGGGRGQELPNLYQYKLQKLYAYKPKSGPRGKIGIPMVLNMYENLPFWHTFFTQLGFEVVTSERSSRALYAKGQHTIPSDTVCYPAKLAHGHMFSLLEQGVKTIFYPCMSYNFDEGISDNCFNCPVVAYYPESLNANLPVAEDVRFLYPYLSLNNRRLFEEKIWDFLQTFTSGISRREVKAAAGKAYAAYAAFRADIAAEGRRAVEFAKAKGLKSIVLSGRPYHIDPEINHGIDKLISTLGFVILSEDAVAGLGEYGKVDVLNQWTYHARMYQAARFVCKTPHTELVQLVSFGCGIDAVTTDELRAILRSSGKLYTQIKIDEINNLGAVKIRLRSLKAAMEEQEEGDHEHAN